MRQELLAAEMGVSRLPIRDALTKLEAEGLVEIRPNRGAYVASLNHEECLEIFDLRVLLECDALRHAIGRHSARSIRALQAVQSELEVENQTTLWVEGDRQFHEMLYAPSGRTRTLELIKPLRNTVERFCIAHLEHNVRRTEWGSEHRALLELVVAQDLEKACRQLTAHLRATQEVVLAAIEDTTVAAGRPDPNSGFPIASGE